MRARDAGILAIAVIAALVVLAVGALGFLGMSTTTTVSDSPAIPVELVDPPADGASGIVFSLNHMGAQRLLGITISRAEHHAHIGIVLPPECIEQADSGAEHLRDDGPCADLPVRGEIAGGGTSFSGHEFSIVRVAVSEACFESLERTDRWPPVNGPCVE